MRKIRFNLEKWKSGNYDVVTKDNKTVRIVSTDGNSNFPILAWVKEKVGDMEHGYVYTKDGNIQIGVTSVLDLYLIRKVWLPKEGEIYYYITSSGEICASKYSEYSDKDNCRIAFGNGYKTKQEAIEAQKKIEKVFKEIKESNDN